MPKLFLIHMNTSLVILHGDNTVASRSALQQHIANARAKGCEVRHVDAKSLTPAQLGDALGSQELFTAQSLIVIEDLFSLPKSGRKDELLKIVSATTQPVIIWEKKTLTATQLKSFSSAQIYVFKTSSAMFAWLDLLGTQDQSKLFSLFQKAIESDGLELCFAMLIRQIRLLLQIQTGVEVKLAPFAIAKLKNQTKLFDEEQLLRLHEQLVHIDEKQKTSGSHLGLRGEVELLMRSMSP